MTDRRFVFQPSTHFRDVESVPGIMYRVVLALVPACLAAVYFFRLRAVVMLLVSVSACVASEAVFLWVRKKPLSAALDGSAVITGLLLAMTLPPSLPISQVIIGAAVAVVIGKQVFGGLGHNIFNPALVGRAFLQAAFPVSMTTWLAPATLHVDAATFATPLASVKFQNALALGTATPLRDLFWGNTGGSLGETSALALLLGGIYLLVKKTIDWRIPFGILLSLVAFTGVFWLFEPLKYASPLFHVLSGGLLLGGLFMATDMVTSPVTPLGTWIYALAIGLMIGLVRLFGGFPEGVMYSILFLNAFVPLLNTVRPRILGEKQSRKQK